MKINLILKNPFRGIGLTSTHSMREFQERLDELEAYKAIGQYPIYDYDFPFLDNFIRNEDEIMSSKELVPDKISLMKHSLFWFSKSDEVDKMALDYISNEKYLSTRELWENSSDNYSYTKNLAILLLVESLYIVNYKDVKQKVLSLSVEKWIELCLNNNFINDYKILFKGEKPVHFILDLILGLIRPHFNDPSNTVKKYLYYEPNIFFDRIDKIDKNIAEYLKDKYLSEINNKINQLYEDHDIKVKNTSAKVHIKYLNEIKKYVDFIRKMYASNLNGCKIICDKVARQLDQCSISVWNENVDTISETDKINDEIQKIKKYALKIAVGNSIIDRIKGGFETQKKVFKEKKEMDKINAVLKPLDPFIAELEKLEELTKCDFHELKQTIYRNRDNLIKVKKLLNHNDSKIVDVGKALCGRFSLKINNLSVNDIGNGRAIELMDMCRRINRTLTGSVIDYDWEQHILKNRSVCLSNINNDDGGWIGGLLGGAIRIAKKNTSCGCNSGKLETECCSIAK